MNLDQQDEASVVQLINAICSRSPRQVPEDALTDFAKQVWYGELDLVPLLREHLVRSGMADEQSRRLLYVVDRLTCYPCMLRSKAAQLREVLGEWADPHRRRTLGKGKAHAIRNALLFRWFYELG